MRIIKINFKNLKEIVKKITKAIRQGKVIICPTDTVYGLICDATNERAVKKLLKIKKRPKEKAIPIFVKDIKMAKGLAFIKGEPAFAKATAGKQEKFLKKVWPGKITVVLKRKENCGLPKILFGREKTIGLRIPDYKLINVLLKKINRPLTGTSANISGNPPSTKIGEVLKQFKNQKPQPDLILDAGNLPKSLPSTVIDLTGKKPKILRKGDFKIRFPN